MSQRSTGPIGTPAGEDWPDDLWPADDEEAGQHGDPAAGSETQAGGTSPLPSAWPGADGTPRARWLRPGVLATTRVTGKVAGLGGIKTGNHVSAQLTQDGGRVTAVAIADPAQAPPGESLP